jgi:pimeloyl-ACP methyl ester carboxylesterase
VGCSLVSSPDGTRIAYAVQGEGVAILLLHGFSGDRQIWRRGRAVEQLSDEFRMIILDLRGCGESSRPTDASDFRLERHLEDIHAVVDACGLDRFLVWGWSLGATLGLQLTVRSERLLGAVIAGTYYGRIFTDGYVLPLLSEYEPLAVAQAQGCLDERSLSSEQRDFIRHTGLSVYLARLRGMHTWPGAEPRDLRCPALVYSSTADSPTIVRKSAEQRVAIESAGIELPILDGLSHLRLITSDTVVFPIVLPFLRQFGQAH